MNVSQKTGVASSIEGSDPLSPSTLAYINTRTQNQFFNYVHDKLRLAEEKGLKRSDLAKRIGKSPTRLSHLLAAPGNWTIGTVAELLAGICREELMPDSASYMNRAPRNMNTQVIATYDSGGSYSTTATVIGKMITIPTATSSARANRVQFLEN